MLRSFNIQGFQLRVGAVPYIQVYDIEYLVGATDPIEVSKKFRLAEAQIIRLICKVGEALLLPLPLLSL